MMHAILPRTLLLLLACARLAYTQDVRLGAATTQVAHTGLQRYEAGLQLADIRTGCIGSQQGCYLPSLGLGIGGTLNINQHIALDANYLATPTSSTFSTNIDGGRASELLMGARVEARGRHYGFFLKAQPGYLDWSHVVTRVNNPTSADFTFQYGHRTHFVSDVGAGIEYSPTSSVHLRAELTDLVMRYTNSSWANNFQPSVAVYYGLGKSLTWKPPIYDPKKAHRFDSPLNLVLIGGNVLASTADAITTQRFVAHGLREGVPFARPLVKYGWSGEITFMSLEMTGEIGSMYGLHRLGQHWVERLMPISLATMHGIFAYNNTKDSFRMPAK